jgi:hypothetical protein
MILAWDIGQNAFQSCPMTSIIIPASVLSIDGSAFFGCFSLKSIFFRGNAASVGSSVFQGVNNPIVYYLPRTNGWSTNFGGLSTSLWVPQMQNSGKSSWIQTNQFGFNINWASGMVVVVESRTNFANSTWSAMATNTLTADSSYFSDPLWTNYPSRFYRLRSP